MWTVGRLRNGRWRMEEVNQEFALAMIQEMLEAQKIDTDLLLVGYTTKTGASWRLGYGTGELPSDALTVRFQEEEKPKWEFIRRAKR